MPIDPEIAAVLQGLGGMSPMETLPLEQLRASLVGPPMDGRTHVASTRDLNIRCGPCGIGARLYMPLEKKRAGLTIFFHGGGFVMGNIESHDHVCRDLCAGSGAAVLSVDYRLAPEHKFPCAPDDCLVAVRWVAENAPSLGVDGTRLVLAGDSAGATLAAVTALRLRDEGGPAIRSQVLIYPVTDYHTPATPSYLENAHGYSLTRAAMQRFWASYVTNEEDALHPYASPLRAPRLSDLPEALVLTAEYDPLRDEGEKYAHRLLDAGVPVTLWRHAGLIHGFIRMGLVSARAKESVERTASWIGDSME